MNGTGVLGRVMREPATLLCFWDATCNLEEGCHRQCIDSNLISRVQPPEPWAVNFHGSQVYEILLRAIQVKTVPLAHLHGTCVLRVLFLVHGHCMSESVLVVHGAPDTLWKGVSSCLTQHCRSLPRVSVTVWWRSRVNLIPVSLQH